MRWLWGLLAGLGLAALALTHLGSYLPIGDALAVARPHLLVLSAPVLFGLWLSGARRPATWAAALVVASVALTALDWRGQAAPGEGALVLYQKNLLWNGDKQADVLEDILAARPDFVTLQEVSRQNQPVLDGLAAELPFSRSCVTTGNGGIVILSRFPLSEEEGDCSFGEGIILARAILPDGRRLWLGSVHLNWPFPYDQARQIPGVIDGLKALQGPVLIAGDFNMVPWGSAVRQAARASGTARIGGYASTFPGFGPFAPLPIDHILIPETGRGAVEVRPRFGSDHYGLLARFDF